MSKVFDDLALPAPAEVETAARDVVITDPTGKELFRQNGVGIPLQWSDSATQIAVSRWFRGKHGTSSRENSAFQVFDRVATALTVFGMKHGYLPNAPESVRHIKDYLVHMQLDQRGVFNTPVYLNAGWSEAPRCSACFLIHVEDNYESLTEHAFIEGRVFQHGGGAGVSVSNISHEGRRLGRGGVASGPLPFNEGWDRSSGAIKSGGSHRRAARDVTMDVRHPDCYRSPEYLATLKHAPLDVDFIREKQVFENIRRDLASLGHDVGLNSLVNYMLPAQNANRAVGVFDEFMQAVEENKTWDVLCPRTGEKVWTYPAQEIWDAICYATWESADPTMKFLDTINKWNPTTRGFLTVDGLLKEFVRMLIDKSNPCWRGDMRLLTPHGYVSFSELATQEQCVLVNKDGEHVRGRVWSTGVKPTVCLTVHGHGKLFCTPDHVMMLSNGESCAAQNTAGRRLRIPHSYRQTNGEFVLLGFMQGEGSLTRLVSKDHKGIDLNFSQKDAEVAALFGLETGPQYIQGYHEKLLYLGFHPVKLPERELPETHGTWLQWDVLSFLRGLYSANGSVIGEHRIALKTTSYALALQVQSALKKHAGIDSSYLTTNKAHEVEFPNGTYACSESYDLNIGKFEDMIKFAEQVGFVQTYKTNALKKLIAAKSPIVRSVREAGESEVFDFSLLQGEHWGVVEGFVTHNCNEVMYPVPEVSGALVACNLAMARLTKYYDIETGKFDVAGFVRDTGVLFAYQDMIVDYSEYPTESGAEWTKANRIIGLSMSDLGGVLMLMGLPYDSDGGRDMAGALCALLLASAMNTSANLAEQLGACAAWGWNKEHALGVMYGHLDHLNALEARTRNTGTANTIAVAAQKLMRRALNKAVVTGFRNMQFVSLAPQGTTGLITDCFSTGPEPLIALRSFKQLIGGGILTQAPTCVADRLRFMIQQDEAFWRQDCLESGWHGEDKEWVSVDEITEWALSELLEWGSLSASSIRPDELKVFETALGVTTKRGETRLALTPEAHVDMLAALQPFVSGAISKTVNLPKSATPKDISDLYFRAWKKGVKAIAVYRDGSKGAQILSTKIDEDGAKPEIIDSGEKLRLMGEIETLQRHITDLGGIPSAHRVKLPEDVVTLRKKIMLGGHKVYLHVGMYETGAVGEIYLRGVHGSFLAGMLDSFAILVSLCLQYGIPFDTLYRKFESVEFSPNGFLPKVGYASSFPAAIMKILKEGIESGEFERFAEAAYIEMGGDVEPVDETDDDPYPGILEEHVPRPTGEPCGNCGSLMVQSGRCKYCTSCGANTGGCG